MKKILIGLMISFLPGVASAQIDTSVWHLEPIWTIGSEESDAFFSSIYHVEIGPDGKIFMSERRSSTVRVFSPDGDELPPIEAKGEGPGDITEIRYLHVSHYGSAQQLSMNEC